MDRAKAAKNICNMHINKEKKIKLMEDFLLDRYNEMEAQDENMRPEIANDNAEGYRIALDCLRKLQSH